MNSPDTVPHGRSCLGYTAPQVRLRSGFVLSSVNPERQLWKLQQTMIARVGISLLAVWVLFSSALFSQAQLPATESPVRVYIERKGGRWVAWYWKPATGLWTIQANRTGFKDGWFTPPGYVDDGVKISCDVPNTPMMIFRAWRVRL